MKTLIRRLLLLLKSWVNALTAPAEDPRQTFAVAFQRQRELLAKVRLAQGRVADSKRQLESGAASARDKLPGLEDQARRALSGGREDQARFALRLRHVGAEQLQHLEQQVRELEEEEQTLSLVERRLATDIEAFFARQEILAVRYDTAEAQVRIKEALSGVSEELLGLGLGLAVQKAEQRTEDMQARVSAIDSLVDLGVLDSATAKAGGVPQLPSAADATIAVEEHLAALKREVGQGNENGVDQARPSS